MNRQHEKVLLAIRSIEPCSNLALANVLGWPAHDVYVLLWDLRDAGLAERLGRESYQTTERGRDIARQIVEAPTLFSHKNSRPHAAAGLGTILAADFFEGASTMKVSVGRIVHYVPRDGGHHQAAIVADVVAAEEGPGELLTLAAWKNTGEFHAVSAVPFDPKGDAAHSWHWPEREPQADEDARPERPNPKAAAAGGS